MFCGIQPFLFYSYHPFIKFNEVENLLASLWAKRSCKW